MLQADRERVVGPTGRKVVDAIRKAMASSYEVTDAIAEIERLDPTVMAELEGMGDMLAKLRSAFNRIAATID